MGVALGRKCSNLSWFVGVDGWDGWVGLGQA